MSKKLVALVLSLLLCVALLAPAALASAYSTYVTLPSGVNALNLRSGPGTNYKVVGYVQDGDEIDLLSAGNSWSKATVQRTNKTGYIKNKYIDKLPDYDNPSTSGTATAARVTGKGVNLRKGPGTGYAGVGSLAYGTKLKVWRSSGNWAYVTSLAGKSGWMSKTYIQNGFTSVTTACVNLRASANGKLIRTLSAGTSVSVQSMTGNWSKVKAGGTTGYVFTKYLR